MYREFSFNNQKPAVPDKPFRDTVGRSTVRGLYWWRRLTGRTNRRLTRSLSATFTLINVLMTLSPAAQVVTQVIRGMHP